MHVDFKELSDKYKTTTEELANLSKRFEGFRDSIEQIEKNNKELVRGFRIA